MTNSEIVELLPRIRKVAASVATNGCDPEDLVQEAVYKLMTRKVVANYPIVTVVSVMKDYIVTNGYKPNSKKLKRRELSNRVEENLPWNSVISHYRDYRCDWSGIPLTETEKDVVELYCEEGWTKRAIAELYGENEMWTLRRLRSAAAKAVLSWGIREEITS